MPEPIALSSSLTLQPVRGQDAEELYEAVDRNRLRLQQWLPWVAPDYCLADAARFLRERVDENESGVALTMLIRNGSKLCGAIGLHRFDPRHRSSSIGYWIDADSEGQGIVTRACRAIVAEGFAAYGLHRIEIRCATGNLRSAAIPLRLGFHEEGILREAEWLHDRFVDLRVFSQLESEAGTVTGY
jgi:ribosomal-protein-serine acetyltransferase